MIGAFGDVIFETSDKKILNFSGFTRNAQGRFAKHEIINNKPLSEFLGPGLDTVTFTVNLNGNFGVKPREEMDRWIVLARSGTANTLVIGNSAIGVDKWAVINVSEAWDAVFNDGKLFSGKIDVTLEEYISRM